MYELIKKKSDLSEGEDDDEEEDDNNADDNGQDDSLSRAGGVPFGGKEGKEQRKWWEVAQQE